MDNIFISFIIPCYHSENTIVAAIQSIFDAIGKQVKYEIILVAEDENDTSFVKLNSYQFNNISIHYSRYPGVTANRNKGLEIAKGEYVYFLDSDDVLFVDDWTKVINFIKGNPRIDVVFGRTKNFNDGCESRLERFNRISNDKEYLDDFYGDSCIVSYSYCSYIIRRSFLIEHNIFVDKTIRNAEDYLFVGLLLTNRPYFAVMDYTLNEYIKREESLSNNRDITSAISFVTSFDSLFTILKCHHFDKSLSRFRYTFVNVHLEVGYRLNSKDKNAFLKTLKKYKVKENVIKPCYKCHKRTLYLWFGYRLSWLFLKYLHRFKGIK